MTFHKALLINISESALQGYWSELDELVEKRVSLAKDSPDIIKEIVDANCVLTSFGIPVTKEMIDAAPGLKYIGVLATAFGKVDAAYARTKNIPVANCSGYSTEAVAELTIGVLLEQLRHLEEAKQRASSGNYSEAGFKAREIRGKIFGVIGLGRIGKRVAELAHGFGADVRYWSREKKAEPFRYQDVDELIAQSDFISLNLAQTSQTEGFITKKRIQSIKPGAIFINTVPMEVVDTDALTERLAQGDITFILDHSDETPKEVMAKLSKFENCVIYPPIGYITDEAQLAKKTFFISNMRAFLAGKASNVVN